MNKTNKTKLLNGDCLELMEGIKDGSVDITITSPPYDNMRDYKGYNFNFKGIAEQLYRVTKNGGVVVWVVGDAVIDGSESGTSFEQALHFKDIGFNLHDTMIYMKKNLTQPSVNRYFSSFEYMFVLCKGKLTTFNPLKDRINKSVGRVHLTNQIRKKDGSINVRKGRHITPKHGMRFNVWEYNVGTGQSTKDKYAFEHPAIFPEKLAEDHILSWSNVGDIVMDPMMGSGTTGKIAVLNNRNFIGIEISEKYFAIAQRRIKQAKKKQQSMLF